MYHWNIIDFEIFHPFVNHFYFFHANIIESKICLQFVIMSRSLRGIVGVVDLTNASRFSRLLTQTNCSLGWRKEVSVLDIEHILRGIGF